MPTVRAAPGRKHRGKGRFQTIHMADASEIPPIAQAVKTYGHR